jgi:hypothetical protein
MEDCIPVENLPNWLRETIIIKVPNSNPILINNIFIKTFHYFLFLWDSVTAQNRLILLGDIHTILTMFRVNIHGSDKK